MKKMYSIAITFNKELFLSTFKQIDSKATRNNVELNINTV